MQIKYLLLLPDVCQRYWMQINRFIYDVAAVNLSVTKIFYVAWALIAKIPEFQWH